MSEKKSNGGGAGVGEGGIKRGCRAKRKRRKRKTEGRSERNQRGSFERPVFFN